MERTLAVETTKKIGQEVRLCGWVANRRDHGKLVFLDLRDRSGIVQVVGGSSLGDLHPQDVVEFVGMVKGRPKKMINPKIPTGEVEIGVDEVKVLAKAVELPIDMGQPELKVELPTLLDLRPLTLRHPKISAVFKVQEVIVDSFRETLKSLGFTEFQAPTIVPVATEGGAEIFPINYYDYSAYLCQSPQLYKQILVGVYERVFSVARAYRAEPSVTTRHLSEYVSLDAEMGFIDSYEDLMDTVELVFRGIFNGLQNECSQELHMFGATIPKIPAEIPKVKMHEAQEIIFKRTGRDNRKEPDLMPEDEKEICKWAQEEQDSELVFITHFPTSKRPFYTYPDPTDPEYTLSFDLLGRGLEWVTGGQRINNYEQLVANIKKRGNQPKDFEFYLQAFKYGMPQEGGFALGAERITMQILGLENVREASLFPRDMERIDVRLSTLTVGKKQDIFEKIVKWLKDQKIDFQVFEHEPVYTSKQAAQVRGTKIEQGAKALVMITDGKPIMVVVSAALKVDTLKLKRILKIKDLKMAEEEEVIKITETEIGAVPPFGNLFGLPVYVDNSLGKNQEIVFNAGLHTRSIKMRYQDYLRLVKPILGDFSEK